MNKIHILGVGPGSRDYLLKITEKKIREAEVLIAAPRILDTFGEAGQQQKEIASNLEDIKNYILKNYQEKKIAVLVSGDPGIYSLMSYLKKYIESSLLEVIPGISSLQLAAARLSLPWPDLEIISLHGRDNRGKVVESLQNNSKIGLLTDHNFPPEQIASFLVNKGFNKKKAIVLENLSYAEERMVQGSLKEIKEYQFARLTVMVILDGKVEI